MESKKVLHTTVISDAFAKPEIYEYLEEKGLLYAIRLPANDVLYDEIKHLLTRPVGRPSRKPVIKLYDFKYKAASWKKRRRVVAKVEWHQGDLFPRVGFIVTNMSAKAEGVVRFYNKRGIAEQWIKKASMLSTGHDFHANNSSRIR